jgi:hypothetical protein
MPSRISYNIHAQRVLEHDRLIKHLEKIKPTAVLVMDGLGLAREIKSLLPDTTVISRIYPDDDVQNRISPEQWFDHRAKETEGGIYAYTSNEAGFGPKLIEWHLRLLEMAIQHRIPLVIGNMSVGTPAPEEWAAGRRVLELLDQHRDLFILGLHEYACAVITSGFLGGHPDNAGVAPNSGQQGRSLILPNEWPSQAEAVDMTMFHCGRFKFLVNYCRSIGIKPPRIVLTEHGFDDVSDIKPWTNMLTMTSPYITIRGWKSAQEQWRKWYEARGWSPQRAMFEQLAYADRTIYQHSPVEGQLIFCWGHSSDMWDQFDVADADEFQELLEAYAQEQPISAPPVKPVGVQPNIAPVGVQSTSFAPVGVRPEDVQKPAQPAEVIQPIGIVPPTEAPASFSASLTSVVEESTSASPNMFDIMTEEDVTVIAAGFRAAASSGIFSPVIAAGFARWSDVLERYHSNKWGVG